MKLMVLNNASKQQQQSSGKAAGGTEAPAAAAATAKAETTAGAEVRKRFEFVLFSLSILILVYLPTLFLTRDNSIESFYFR